MKTKNALLGGALRYWLLMGFGLAVCAVVMWYAGMLVGELRTEETKRIEMWADATRLLATDAATEEEYIDILLRIVQDNTTIPVALTDAEGNVLQYRNLAADGAVLTDQQLESALAELIASGQSIDIALDGDEPQRLFYSNSSIVRQLSYYPFVQIGLVFLFVVFAYNVYSRARRKEQDRVWEGLARETAHQLGTPITALVGWSVLLKSGDAEPAEVGREIDGDIKRLQRIADRFSKIGSEPDMKSTPLRTEVEQTVGYLRVRAGRNVTMAIECEADFDPSPLHNRVLLSWAVENLCRNAIDAMPSGGSITVRLMPEGERTIIDIIDTGKGMTKSQARHIFDAGFTTKTRGWGIGLTLARRIIVQYHKGKIFVLNTEVGVGTTIRIVLP